MTQDNAPQNTRFIPLDPVRIAAGAILNTQDLPVFRIVNRNTEEMQRQDGWTAALRENGGRFIAEVTGNGVDNLPMATQGAILPLLENPDGFITAITGIILR